MRICTARRITRADKHGQGGGKIIAETYREIPDAMADYAMCDIAYATARDEDERKAIRQAAKERFGVVLGA